MTAVLEHESLGERHPIGATHIVGRSDACSLRVMNPRTSRTHAEMTWDGSVWHLRDLASRNGTYVGRRRLAPGERAQLGAGDVIAFGDLRDTYRFVAAGPPAPVARSDRGERVQASGDRLYLPKGSFIREAPRDAEHGDDWLAVDLAAGESISGRDGGREIHCGGRRWHLERPVAPNETCHGEITHCMLDQLHLCITVSRNQDYVTIVAIRGGQAITLDSYVHNDILLVLARQRLHDSHIGLPEAEQGWMDREILMKEVGMDETRLNAEVYKARQHFRKVGLIDYRRIIQCRNPRQRRLGTGNVEIDSMAPCRRVG